MQNDIIWLEKYRPKTLADVVGNQDIVQKLEYLKKEENIQNLILTGPPGCGKTTSILALCREILQENFDQATIELNASDERGIDVIRTRVRQFAEKLVKLKPGHHKVVILDEADSLTQAAQQALRMIISDYSHSTRFVFSCNNSTKIIEPLQSRCSILRFHKLEDQEIERKIIEICENEGVKYDQEGINALIFVAEGDMRNAINNLQAIFNANKIVTRQNIYEICDVPNSQLIENMFYCIRENKFQETLQLFKELWDQNYCIFDLIKFMNKILDGLEIDFSLKLELQEVMARLKMLEAKGLGTKTQIMGSISEMIEISSNYGQIIQGINQTSQDQFSFMNHFLFMEIHRPIL